MIGLSYLLHSLPIYFFISDLLVQFLICFISYSSATIMGANVLHYLTSTFSPILQVELHDKANHLHVRSSAFPET